MHAGPPATEADWSAHDWHIAITDTELIVARPTGEVTISSTEAARVEVRRRWFRWRLDKDGQAFLRLRSMTKSEATDLAAVVRWLALTPVIADAVAWHAAVTDLLARTRTEQRWISTEAVDRLLGAHPEPQLLDLFVRQRARITVYR